MKSKKNINEIIEKKGIKKKYIAYELRIRPETLSRKLKNPQNFSVKEMSELSIILQTSLHEMDFGVNFFGMKSEFNSSSVV